MDFLYSKMKKSEDTDFMYEDWTDYRNTLTSYILESVDKCCPKKSFIAIWGAGGCNDIDILRISRDYNLLLIDRDIEKLAAVRERLGLREEVCKIADVGFWNVSDDDYEMFEALLMDGAKVDELEDYFSELINNMNPPMDLRKYTVEASVVVGLTSQLNSRFAGLIHLYKEHLEKKGSYNDKDFEKIFGILEDLNKSAVEKLFLSIRQLTKTLLLTGYEMKTFYNKEDMLGSIEEYKSLFDVGKDGDLYLSGRETEHIIISGNCQWHKLLSRLVSMDIVEDMCLCDILPWIFTKEKQYLMMMSGFRFVR